MLVACLILASAPAFAKDLVNVDKEGLALQGHDPVAFFTDGRPVKGDPAITAKHRGATYRFTSAASREAFAKEPDRYAPAFGGFCAYGLSQGYTAPIEIGTWQIVEGRLLLNYNASVKKKFDADRAGLLKKADSNWPGLVEKQGS
jgi:YHS domain-containing protein